MSLADDNMYSYNLVGKPGELEQTGIKVGVWKGVQSGVGSTCEYDECTPGLHENFLEFSAKIPEIVGDTETPG